MTSRLLACYFATRDGSASYWDRLVRVLGYSASLQCPGWEIRIDTIQVPTLRAMFVESLADNTHKLAWWHQRVEEAADGDRLLLIDADTAILRPLDSLWQREFDFAYTARTGSRFKLNGGVIFLRVSNRTRAFMEAWVKQNAALLSMKRREWRRRAGGVNQASLEDLIQAAGHFGVRLLELPCAEWNCEDSAWGSFDPDVTRILHIKSLLRIACIDRKPLVSTDVRLPAQVWRALEHAATAQAKTA